MASKKASGENIPEAFRNTVAVKLRLKPEVAQMLYSLSTEIGDPDEPATYAETIRQALEALNREMNAETAENKSDS